MVIGITDADIECNPAIQFLQIILHVGTVLKYEIDNIQIAMAGIGIITII
ncbi:unknown [Bacteroides sp. CAG:20]|nr:unknown [Bacteroides sp. CAG:20]